MVYKFPFAEKDLDWFLCKERKVALIHFLEIGQVSGVLRIT